MEGYIITLDSDLAMILTVNYVSLLIPILKIRQRSHTYSYYKKYLVQEISGGGVLDAIGHL